MTLHRFYCPNIRERPVAFVDDSEARHALQSLRLRDNDEVQLFDGRGTRGSGRLDSLVGVTDPHARKPRKPRGLGVRMEHIETVEPPLRSLTLIVAGCKGPRMDWLVEKCTELGVSRLIFARFERSVVMPRAGHIEKLRRTAIEACKQCGRDWLPELVSEIPLADALLAVGHAAENAVGAAAQAHATSHTAVFVAHPAVDSTPVAIVAPEMARRRCITGIVGPEGGLTDTEVALLVGRGGRLVRLGAHVLRVETAAVSLASLWAASA